MTFVFANGAGPKSGENPYVIEIPGGLSSQEELVRTLARQLSLPEVPQQDWEDLCKSFGSAGKADGRKLLLNHADLPLRDDPRQCRNYLRVLWNAHYGHHLLAGFPLEEKPEIVRLLSTHEPERRETRPYRRISTDFNCVSYTNDSYERLSADFPETVFDEQRGYWLGFTNPFNAMIDQSTLRDGEVVELFEPYEWFWCEARLAHMGDGTWEAVAIKGTFVYPDNVPNDGGPLKLAREYF